MIPGQIVDWHDPLVVGLLGQAKHALADDVVLDPVVWLADRRPEKSCEATLYNLAPEVVQ